MGLKHKGWKISIYGPSLSATDLFTRWLLNFDGSVTSTSAIASLLIRNENYSLIYV